MSYDDAAMQYSRGQISFEELVAILNDLRKDEPSVLENPVPST